MASRSQETLPRFQLSPPPPSIPAPQETTSSAPRQRARRPTIRLQRPVSFDRYSCPAEQNPNTHRHHVQPAPTNTTTYLPPPQEGEAWEGNRRRSNSEPRRGRYSAPNPTLSTHLSPGEPMRPLIEESPTSSPVYPSNSPEPFPEPILWPPPPIQLRDNRNLLRRTSQAAFHRLSRSRAATVSGNTPLPPEDISEYDQHIVDVLDVIDPEVSALNTLTNVQNSLFIPNLGSFLNRNQTYTLSPPPEYSRDEESSSTDEGEETSKVPAVPPPLERGITSLSTVLDEGEPRFAVLPEGSNLQGWSHRDVEELNDHVRHMLHSRRSKFKRAMRGFGKYVSKPLGFLVTLYATLITLFGLAWVLFLIGWINVGGKQLYMINIIDNILVALFAIMGDGLAPFRAVDTYHMIFIARYTFLTWKIRRKRHLPNLKDKNDLPSRRETEVDMEYGDVSKVSKVSTEDENEFSVLSCIQQTKLQHHQDKFSKSHTFYKPHETITHHAFPLRLLIAIVVLLDCHSLFQIALGACTWGISYHVRPFALTTVILCCSITCNILGGVLIMVGDRRTRKTEVVEKMFRQKLTKEAIKKIEKKRKKEEDKEKPSRTVTQSDSSSSIPTVPYKGA